MDNNSFKEYLVKLGMNKKSFAEKMGIKQQTVNSWTAKGIPYWVEPFLECMLELKNLKDSSSVDDAIKKLIADQEDLAEKVKRLTGGQSL